MTITSNNFTFFTKYLHNKLHLTTIITNKLKIINNKFTNNIINNIINTQYKTKTLTHLTQKYKIPLTQTITINNKTNNLPIIKTTKLKITYHTKPKINKKTKITIHHTNLIKIFYILSNNLNQK